MSQNFDNLASYLQRKSKPSLIIELESLVRELESLVIELESLVIECRFRLSQDE